MGNEKIGIEGNEDQTVSGYHLKNSSILSKPANLPFELEHDSAIISVTDSRGIIKYANANFSRISKFSREELTGHDHRIVNSGYHSKDFFQELWSTISAGQIWKGEIMNKAKDGSFFWLDTTIIPFLDEEDALCQYVSVRSDITLRKKAEEEIKKLNLDLEKRVSDRTGELDAANQEQAFQHSEKEFRAAELIIANQELRYQSNEKENRAAELKIANKELLFQNNEKENRAAELIIANDELQYQSNEKENRAAELLIANQELLFQNREKENRAAELLEAFRELKISEEQVKEINRELESFSYSVSHDLRAPLRAIHGYSKMLKTNFESGMSDEANRLVNKIVINAGKMGQLIDDLLDFSRMGRKELIKTEMPMNSIVANICRELEKEFPDRNIEFRVNTLLPGFADHITIKNVWQNLISNAVKYTGLKETGIIEIGSVQVDNEVIYHVKDNGAGFDMKYADKLFGVFQRLHSEDEFEGTGVGLALAQRIILKHGGKIWAKAEVDRGACFYFTLNAVAV